MRKRNFVVLLVLAAMCVTAGGVWADDINPPPWRGQDGSTYQQWTFVEPFVLEANNHNNQYGIPIVEQQTITAWQPGSVQAIALTFQIPNRPQPNPVKYIRIQATFSSPAGVPGPDPGVDVVSLPPSTTLITGTSLDLNPLTGYWHAMWDIELRPNPYLEWITIGGGPNQTWPFEWHQVDIDTWCPPVPEPMSMTLAGIGLAGVLGARRRKA